MKIYLDNCCFNRPYDDQSQLRILLESEAKLRIQENIRSGTFELVWSYILDYENSQNPFRERREQIIKWRTYFAEDIEENEDVLNIASIAMSYGIKKLDSLHLACANKGQVQIKQRTFFKLADPLISLDFLPLIFLAKTTR